MRVQLLLKYWFDWTNNRFNQFSTFWHEFDILRLIPTRVPFSAKIPYFQVPYFKCLNYLYLQFFLAWPTDQKKYIFEHSHVTVGRSIHICQYVNTHREISIWILLHQTKFVFQLHFSDRYSTKRDSVSCQINRRNLVTIKVWFRSGRFDVFQLVQINRKNVANKASEICLRFIVQSKPCW